MLNKNTRILVTGAGGFLGRAVMRHLISAGYTDVRCLLRQPLPTFDEEFRGTSESHVEAVVGNLLRLKDAERAVAGREVVFHLAAGTVGAPSDLFLNSVVATKYLLEAAVRVPVRRIVLVSSFGVYGAADLPHGAVLNEATPLEPHPDQRDPYSYAKLRQEELVRDYQQNYGFELVILRPGVIYGPGGGPFSPRVGIRVPGVFLHFGRGNSIPLTFVENCANATVFAGTAIQSAGQVYNIVDDNVPTSRQYLRSYRRAVEQLRCVTVPYGIALILSRLCLWYHTFSRGQMPAFLTPYKSASLWRSCRFSNEKIKSLGWGQFIPTEVGLQSHFAALRARLGAPDPRLVSGANDARTSQSEHALAVSPAPNA